MSSIFDCSVDTSLLEGMRKAKLALAKGDLVVVPTDTVYGIAADAFNADAVQALLDAKGRGRQSPPPVLIPNVDSLYALADTVSDTALKLAEKYWPGALTIILRSQPSLHWDLGETRGTVALRVPNHKITLALLAESGPLAVSSANLTGEPAALNAQQGQSYFGDKVAVYLDGGDAALGEASTILDLTGEKVRIVREGALKRAELQRISRRRTERRVVRAYLLIALVTAIVTFGATWAVLKLALKYKIYPEIRARDAHTTPTPRLGGLAMLVGLLVGTMTAASFGWFRSVFDAPMPIIAILGAATFISVLGLLDDLYDLDWTLKLAGQFIAAGFMAWQGVQIVSLPIGGVTIASFGMSFVLSVFLTVLIMNAVNFIDGLDGLVAGVVLIGTTVFFVYTYLLAQRTDPTNYFNLGSMISAIVMGMCLGFLPLNWHRAKIFMGDSGALLLGLLMTAGALSVTGQIDPATVNDSQAIPALLPLILPLAIIVVPLLDFTLAVVRRLRAGKSPFTADRKHLHHRLQDFGHGHLGTVLVFYSWTALISISCLLLFFMPGWAVALFFVLGFGACMAYTLKPLLKRKVAK